MRKRQKSTSSPDLASLAEQMQQDLALIRRALRRPLEAEAAKGELTLPQSIVMREVVRNEGINLRDLSRAVSLAHSTVSGIVDRLEKRGMLERRPDPKDGRITCIHPSAPVREFVKERIPALNQGPLLAALERARVDERIAISAAVRRFRELLEEDLPAGSGE
jgi:DNA-binding MarR family transcriptional regulator